MTTAYKPLQRHYKTAWFLSDRPDLSLQPAFDHISDSYIAIPMYFIVRIFNTLENTHVRKRLQPVVETRLSLQEVLSV